MYLAFLLASLLLAVLLSPMLPTGLSPAYALPIGALSLLLLSRWLGSGRGIVLCLVVHVGLVGIVLVAFGFLPVTSSAAMLGPANRMIESVTGETPQAKVSSYLEVVVSGAREEALGLWPANERLGPEYEVRRQSVTTELEELGAGLSHRVLRIEWWGTCCEPRVITDSRGAGFARLWVEVSGGNEPGQYVFDLLVAGGCYWGEMQGHPVRHWQIVDIYPPAEEPVYWRWPGKRIQASP